MTGVQEKGAKFAQVLNEGWQLRFEIIIIYSNLIFIIRERL